MALVWNGAEFVTERGSDPDESDSEQPLTESNQVVAILNANWRRFPPLPAIPKHARATASAVMVCIRAIPEAKRTIAHDHVLRTPIAAPTIADWIDQQLDERRTENTIRAAMVAALNPNRSVVWIGAKARSGCGNIYIAKGMGYHLRCHAFTRSDVHRGLNVLSDLCQHREERNRVRERLRQRTAESLDAAVVLIGFHSRVRHFGAHRYRYVFK